MTLEEYQNLIMEYNDLVDQMDHWGRSKATLQRLSEINQQIKEMEPIDL